jgi:alpha-L-rhamnosidase
MLAAISACMPLRATEWIAGDYVRPAEDDTDAFLRECPNDVLRRSFTTKAQPVASAVWKVAAPGMRDLFVNGARVSSTPLPPWTPYRERIIEETFDVTRLVASGAANELRVELGNGWWNLMPIRMWYRYEMWKILPQGVPSVKATLEITYADGSRQQVGTDGSWQAGHGRIVKNSIYLGVKEDARLAVGGWKGARCVEGPAGKIVSADGFPHTVIYDRWRAKEVKHVTKGVWRIDFGVNFAGTFRAALHRVPKGATVRFRSGERLNDDGTVNVMTAVAGQNKNPDRGPLFDIAEQRDEWVSDGAEKGMFEPRFTFHCFRYIQVEGLPAAPKAEDFEALAWSADVKDAAHFECSDAKLNLLHAVCRRTFRANMQSVQSDCPGREKFGYGGDLACTAESFRCNWAMHAFYRKMLRDFLDEAKGNGLFTETAPYVGIGSRAVIPDEETGGRAAAPMGWAVGVPVLLDVLVRYDGDLDAVREAYPALIRYIDILSRRYPNDDIPQCLGDWIAVEKADCGLSCLAHWHEFLAKTARFARLIGKADDAAALTRHAERVAAKFRSMYVKGGGLVNRGFQGEQLFALYHGLLDRKDVPAAQEILRKDIAAHGDALTTGIFTTQYLFEYLSSHGDADLAGKVAVHKDPPGYFGMLDAGATTLWEDWFEKPCRNSYSNCHPMFGSIEQWFMRYVLGIAVCEDAVGCDRVRIAPHAVAGITSASGWLDTPKGRISVSWKLAGGRLAVEKTVPDGVKVVE